MSETVSLPLGTRGGGVVGYTVIDAEDQAWLAAMKWHRDAYGYARNGQGGLMHRLILGLAKGDSLQGDHINGDRLDNRRSNLRAVTWAANAQNIGNTAGSSSRFRGVSLHRTGKWRARVVINKREVSLGLFASEDEAAQKASAYRQQVFPYSEERYVR